MCRTDEIYAKKKAEAQIICTLENSKQAMRNSTFNASSQSVNSYLLKKRKQEKAFVIYSIMKNN